MNLRENAITHFDHREAPLCALNEGLLAGLRHRTVIDHSNGARELALWQEEHMPGFLVPLHRHDCEEIITVLAGEILAEDEIGTVVVRAGQSILIPANSLHGFRVSSDIPVRLLAIFGSPSPKVLRADGTPSSPPWEGGASDHLAPRPT